MRLLWFTWKDQKNPLAGGAETVNEELAQRLVQNGHEVIFLTAGFPKSVPEEIVNGYKIIRLGNRWTVYWQAYRYYKKNLISWADLVIDEVNTIPFLCKLYVKEKNIVLFYQLCREIWFYQMFFPLSLIGYLLEPLYLRFLSDRSAITISKSSKNDLLRYGFSADKIKIIRVGIGNESLGDLSHIEKYDQPTLLSLGSVRPMKRTLDILRAFELAKSKLPDLRLVVAGDASGAYGQRFLAQIKKSSYRQDIEFLGPVSQLKKIELMRKAHCLAVTSLKEGWGLIVTEANSQGTPAVVYNVDGLRDSVRNHQTGIVTNKNTPDDLAQCLVDLLKDKSRYDNLSRQAWEWSQEITFANSFKDFLSIINF